MRIKRAVVLLAVLTVGCAGAPTVVDLPTGGIYHGQELGGTWPVVVLGAPFPGVAPATLASIVAAGMPQGLAQNAGFVPAPPGPPPSLPPERRVVWVFGTGVTGGDGSAICQSAGGGGPQGGHVRAYAALCRGPSALSAVEGDVDGVASVDDPGFRRLVHDMTLELFGRHPDQSPDDRSLRPFGFMR